MHFEYIKIGKYKIMILGVSSLALIDKALLRNGFFKPLRLKMKTEDVTCSKRASLLRVSEAALVDGQMKMMWKFCRGLS